MIDNDVVKEIEFDEDLLQLLIYLGKELITQEWIDAPARDALRFSDNNLLYVKNYPKLLDYQQKHPKLNPYLKLMKWEPGHISAHIDKQRETSLNIPVHNCNEGTVTRLFTNYKIVDEIFLESNGSHGPMLWKSNEHIDFIEGGEVLFEYSLLRPTIMDTQVPHDVINSTDSYRLIWNWTFNGSFKEAVQDLL